MTKDNAIRTALSALQDLIPINPDEAFRKVKTDLVFGLAAFIPKETLTTSENVQFYEKMLETAQQEIFHSSLAAARYEYNEGFILASLISLHRQWSNDASRAEEVSEIAAKLKELMRSTENEFIRQHCQNALRDIIGIVVADEVLAALSELKKLIRTSPETAFKKATADLLFGLVAFKPQETLKWDDPLRLYVKKLESAQREIIMSSIVEARRDYNDGFILASLVSFYRRWSGNVDLEGELQDFSTHLEELMQSTENKFIRQSCRNALRDMTELEAYIFEQSEFYSAYLDRYCDSKFDPKYISDLLLNQDLSEIKVFGFLLAIYRNNRYLRRKLRKLVDRSQITLVLAKVLEGIGEFSKLANRDDLRRLADGFFRAERTKYN